MERFILFMNQEHQRGRKISPCHCYGTGGTKSLPFDVNTNLHCHWVIVARMMRFLKRDGFSLWPISLRKKKKPRFLGGLVGGGNTHSSSSSLSLKNKVWGGKR